MKTFETIQTDLNIKMLLPCEADGRPIVPRNYDGWCRRSKGFNGIKIWLPLEILFEEYDDFIYIKLSNREFVRYSIKEDVIYLWDKENTPIVATTVKTFKEYCDLNGIQIDIKYL